MRNRSIQNLAVRALVCALCLICTLVVQIPLPMGGYVHPGDMMVLLGGVLLGPLWGGLAGGVGSALADILSGYALYAPATALIKFALGFLGGAAFAAFSRRFSKSVSAALAGLCACWIVPAGYFLADTLILGSAGAALSGLFGNCAQGLFGMLGVWALSALISRVPIFWHFNDKE